MSTDQAVPQPFIRDGAASDLAASCRLNREWEHVTSPLTEEELARLAAEAALFRVVEIGGEVSAFLLAFATGADYDSLNYRWFDERGDGFLYIDRVVVSAASQRRGLGDALYADAFRFAREHGFERVVCEIDVEPMNAASDAFHDRWAFVEVGTQRVAGGAKRVSLRQCDLREVG